MKEIKRSVINPKGNTISLVANKNSGSKDTNVKIIKVLILIATILCIIAKGIKIGSIKSVAINFIGKRAMFTIDLTRFSIGDSKKLSFRVSGLNRFIENILLLPY